MNCPLFMPLYTFINNSWFLSIWYFLCAKLNKHMGFLFVCLFLSSDHKNWFSKVKQILRNLIAWNIMVFILIGEQVTFVSEEIMERAMHLNLNQQLESEKHSRCWKMYGWHMLELMPFSGWSQSPPLQLSGSLCPSTSYHQFFTLFPMTSEESAHFSQTLKQLHSSLASVPFLPLATQSRSQPVMKMGFIKQESYLFSQTTMLIISLLNIKA